MTTIFIETVKCALCSKESSVTVIGSSNTMAPPDLDLRPAEMLRSTMDFWVQRCPHCGYCAPEINKGGEEEASVARTDAYLKQLKDKTLPELANSFLCCAMLREHAKDYAKAGMMTLYAAWCCDDARKRKSAKKCRLEALRLLQQARKMGQRFARDETSEVLILVDLLRRTGQFQEALRMCEEGLENTTDEKFAAILQYQRQLITSSDTSCHTIGEVDAWH